MSEEFEDAGTEPADGAVDGAVDATVAESDDPASEEFTDGSAERTGNHAVDRVLESLDEIAGKPVDEHVAVFERAHEQLRGALDGPRLPRP